MFKARDRSEYAGTHEFACVFESERAGLQKLALLLTAHSDVAKQCLIRAFQECVTRGAVSKEWALSWARRMVIRNAIGLVMGPVSQPFSNTNDDADGQLGAFSLDDSLGAIAAPDSILDLPEFERFVFVICVLEGYSIHDCALLLGKSPQEVSEARDGVGRQLGQTYEPGTSTQQDAMRSVSLFAAKEQNGDHSVR